MLLDIHFRSPFLWLPCFQNEPYIMYCLFVFSFYVFPFPTLSTACSYAFVTSARVFLERAIHACINCFFHTLRLLVPCLLLLWMSVCYFGRHVQKRANYMDVLLACFLLSFLSILYFSNSMLVCVCYPGWRVFRTSHTCIYPFPTYPTAISARVMFSERAIHAFYIRLLFRLACWTSRIDWLGQELL